MSLSRASIEGVVDLSQSNLLWICIEKDLLRDWKKAALIEQGNLLPSFNDDFNVELNVTRIESSVWRELVWEWFFGEQNGF